MSEALVSSEEFADIWFENDGRERAKEYTVLAAGGDLGDYEESLYALLSKGEQLFEYEGSHCSCNGFEFDPSPVTPEYVRERMKAKSYYLTDALKAQVLAALDAFERSLAR